VEREQLEEMGPIDYVVLEWPNQQPVGEAAPLILDAVDRGIIRILDVALLAKDSDGTVATLEIGAVDGGGAGGFADFEGASSGLLGEDDYEEAGAAIGKGCAAALLVYENTWAAPFATALRRGGAELVAAGRIPVNAVIAALDELEGRE
jgi:hypothetical protein